MDWDVALHNGARDSLLPSSGEILRYTQNDRLLLADVLFERRMQRCTTGSSEWRGSTDGAWLLIPCYLETD